MGKSNTLSQPPHQPPPHATIDHTSHAKRGYDPPHPGQATAEPVLCHLAYAASAVGAIVQIQPPQVQRRAQQLDAGGGQDLRHALARHQGFPLVRERDQRREPRGQVEGGENGEGVAEREERIACGRNGAGDESACGRGSRWQRTEHPRKLAVFVEAEGHVDGGSGEEFGRTGGRGGCRGSGERAVDRVGCVGG